jgi:hypothetical protein
MDCRVREECCADPGEDGVCKPTCPAEEQIGVDRSEWKKRDTAP